MTLHDMTSEYITVHYTTLHYTTLHYTTLHCTALHCTALHCTALRSIPFHSIPFHSIPVYLYREVRARRVVCVFSKRRDAQQKMTRWEERSCFVIDRATTTERGSAHSLPCPLRALLGLDQSRARGHARLAKITKSASRVEKPVRFQGPTPRAAAFATPLNASTYERAAAPSS